MINQISKKDCCGCEACRQICPQGVIVMEEDWEGFRYPQVEAGCMGCGQCLRVCPLWRKEE